MSKKKRLGRGLDALLSKPAVEEPEVVSERLHYLPVELLERGQYQPRSDIRQDSLEDLASSIRAQGVVQPIVARPLRIDGKGAQRYEIIAGERRWRAAQLAGLAEIPAVVRDIEDESAIAMALIENIQREDLNPLEEAKALDRLVFEFDLTHQQAADAVGRSRAAVSNLLRLLELADKVKPLLEERKLEMGHARALLALSDPGEQLRAAREVVNKGLSVRDTERLVRRLQGDGSTKGKTSSNKPDADVRRLETELSDKLAAKVRIDHAAKGFGKVVIHYNSLDELDGILKHIN
ncbi:MAG: ParB/RepB/Spo0J family partition protein [Pseudomonadota bacterium]